MKLKFDFGAIHIIFVMFCRSTEMANLTQQSLQRYINTDMSYLDENNSLHHKLGSIPGNILKKYHRPKKL